MKKSTFAALVLFMALAIVWWWYITSNSVKQKEEVEVRREVVVDTIRVKVPVPVDSVVLRYETVRLPKAPVPVDVERDTTAVALLAPVRKPDESDSVEVVVPITQTVYEDSLYRAYVSGFNARLDSISIFRRTEKIYIRSPTKQKRFSVGIQAGYGMTPKGFQPYLGVGITATLFSF